MAELAPRESRPLFPVRVEPSGPDGFAWRLTAANGRSMARSADTFASPAAALAAFDDAVQLAATHPLPGTVGHRASGWGWTVLNDTGRPLAHSPRTFERHGSCARSLHRFRAALAELATVDDD